MWIISAGRREVGGLGFGCELILGKGPLIQLLHDDGKESEQLEQIYFSHYPSVRAKIEYLYFSVPYICILYGTLCGHGLVGRVTYHPVCEAECGAF